LIRILFKAGKYTFEVFVDLPHLALSF